MSEETTRAEHLAWCKRRAMEYVDAGDLSNAVASMGSDLSKHPETRANDILMMLVYGMSSITMPTLSAVDRGSGRRDGQVDE